MTRSNHIEVKRAPACAFWSLAQLNIVVERLLDLVSKSQARELIARENIAWDTLKPVRLSRSSDTKSYISYVLFGAGDKLSSDPL